MGRQRLQCRLCSAGHAAFALLALALPSIIHAARLPASEAQVPFVLSQQQQATGSYGLWQQYSPTGEAGSPSDQLKTMNRYQDEAVARIRLDGLDDGEVTHILQELEIAEFDVWQRRKNEHVDVRVPPSFFKTALYDKLQDRTSIILPSVQELVDKEAQSQQAAWSNIAVQSHASLMTDPSGGLHTLYHSQASIESLLELFASDFPQFAKLERIGKSAEGRDMFSLRISDYRRNTKKASATSPSTWRTYSRKALRGLWPSEFVQSFRAKPKHKLGFALLGGQHAREWISPAALIYIAHSLVYSASMASTSSISSWSDEQHEIMTLLSDYEMHFIPIANPDGYVYAWDHDRLWVRSRQHLGSNDTRCHGIDLNRNWGYKWEKSYRPNPCSDLYPGAEPFESVENQVIRRYLEDVKKNSRMDVFMDVHSFGQLIMYPYSYSCAAVPPDAENLFEALLRASKAIHGVHKQNYDVGGVCDVSYTATGQSLDWTYHDLGAKWSFAANLRDQGVYAFLLPPEQIVPTGQEMLAGILDLAQFIAQKERIES